MRELRKRCNYIGVTQRSGRGVELEVGVARGALDRERMRVEYTDRDRVRGGEETQFYYGWKGPPQPILGQFLGTSGSIRPLCFVQD